MNFHKKPLRFQLLALTLSAAVALTACGTGERLQSLSDDVSDTVERGYDKTKDTLKEGFKDGPLFDKGSGQIDPQGGLTRDDYRALAPRDEKKEGEETVESEEPPIPDVSQIMIAPRPPKIADEQMVSLSVTDDVPIKDVLIELARLADVDLQMDPTITGGIILRAKDRPFSEVVERVCDRAKLRCTMLDRVLKVEKDTPYMQTYSLDFLNVVRSSESSVNISTNVLSAGEGDNSSLNTGSSSSISSSSESDFWDSINSTLTEIVGQANAEIAEEKAAEEAAAAAAALPDAMPAGLAEASGGRSGNSPIQPMAEEIASKSSSKSSSKGSSSTTASASSSTPGGSYYIINRQGSTLTIYAPQKQQKQIADYIEKLRLNSTSQVLIEAKIVEVSLNENFSSGINWGMFDPTGGFDLNFQFGPNASNSSLASGAGAITFANAGTGEIEALLNLTEQFGTTRTLSSPRLHAMNNQQAVLTFAQNHVYFELDVERETNSSSATNQELFTVDSTVKTVPIGIIVTLQPSINVETSEVTLNVRPTLSRVVDTVSDPAVASLAAQTQGLELTNDVPVVEVRELDTTMKMQSGAIMVMGGLIEQRNNNDDKGVPGFSEIPLVGSLFKNVDRDSNTVEMVIFIKATIIPPSGGAVPEGDKKFYNKFTTDPQPLTF
ncbi:MAG: hypothetical protein IT567_01155 [Alphaproteobacteria bacterium]|nr:hypothetical protein [Alphaproteobacteria bacterium]